MITTNLTFMESLNNFSILFKYQCLVLLFHEMDVRLKAEYGRRIHDLAKPAHVAWSRSESRRAEGTSMSTRLFPSAARFSG